MNLLVILLVCHHVETNGMVFFVLEYAQILNRCFLDEIDVPAVVSVTLTVFWAVMPCTAVNRQ
jgi:hypothetical protein